MSATLDDLLYVATSTQQDARVHFDRLAGLLEGRAGSGAKPEEKPATFMQGLTTGPARIIGMFAALEKSLIGFGNQVAKFVSQASPAHMIRWNMAIADLHAVIGKALIPVMEKVTAMVRKLGDAFASLSPEAQKLAVGVGIGAGIGATITAMLVAGKLLIAVFGGIPVLIGTLVAAFVGVAATMTSGKAIAAAFGSALKALSMLVEALALVLVPLFEAVLVPAFDALADAAKDAASGLKQVIDALREAAGLDPLKDKSSAGAAVRPAQIGDIQSFINKAYTSAFQGSASTVQDKQLDELKGIRLILSRSTPFSTPSDSWASSRPGAERVGGWIGGDEGRRIGRGAGAVADVAAAPFTAAPRAVVATLRSLYGLIS